MSGQDFVAPQFQKRNVILNRFIDRTFIRHNLEAYPTKGTLPPKRLSPRTPQMPDDVKEQFKNAFESIMESARLEVIDEMN